MSKSACRRSLARHFAMNTFERCHKYLLVEGHRLAYLDEGDGPPCSYLIYVNPDIDPSVARTSSPQLARNA